MAQLGPRPPTPRPPRPPPPSPTATAAPQQQHHMRPGRTDSPLPSPTPLTAPSPPPPLAVTGLSSNSPPPPPPPSMHLRPWTLPPPPSRSSPRGRSPNASPRPATPPKPIPRLLRQPPATPPVYSISLQPPRDETMGTQQQQQHQPPGDYDDGDDTMGNQAPETIRVSQPPEAIRFDAPPPADDPNYDYDYDEGLRFLPGPARPSAPLLQAATTRPLGASARAATPANLQREWRPRVSPGSRDPPPPPPPLAMAKVGAGPPSRSWVHRLPEQPGQTADR
ncbi:hypothetical protein PLESTM_001240000 [Pleodorina starrii]|nr:hypothetical protein PLESTM_001240000 [Pleodorina starrii]